MAETRGTAATEDTAGTTAAAPAGQDGLYLGDAIHFFLSAKRAGGRSARTVDDYRKKLELFQRWVARRIGGEDAVDAPYTEIGADEVEAYAVYLRDGRGMADSSRKNHLAVLKSFFETLRRRLKVKNPFEDLDEVRFHQKSPKRSYLTKREAEMLLSPIAQQVTLDTPAAGEVVADADDPKAARKRAGAGRPRPSGVLRDDLRGLEDRGDDSVDPRGPVLLSG